MAKKVNQLIDARCWTSCMAKKVNQLKGTSKTVKKLWFRYKKCLRKEGGGGVNV